MIDEILDGPELRARPPVLLDIGASGALHRVWKPIARHAVCIAFDADDRDFATDDSRARLYKTLHLHNHIVTATPEPRLDFYLTRSAHCSSTLPPDNARLDEWIFAELFDVERKTELRARTLPEILREHRLDYVDYFKTDSQGTDLRLFVSLGEAITARVLAADFEPGILDAYHGEDKLHALMAHMDRLPFWMHALEVRGTQRLSRRLWQERIRALTGGLQPLGLKVAPGWAEVSYLNTLPEAASFDLRDHLLAWVLATVHEQHGFALDIAVRGQARFGDARFAKLAELATARTVSVADRYLPDGAKKLINVVRDVGTRLLRR